MVYIRVKKADAENIRLSLLKSKSMDPDLKIFSDSDHVYFPVKNYTGKYELIEIEGRRRFHLSPYEKILRNLELNDELKKLVPPHWEKYGDVVLVQLPADLLPHRFEIGKAFAEVLNAKSVLLYRGVKGEMRIPDTEFIYGNDSIAVHTENGIFYKFDASRIMFSSGNVDERIRMGRINAVGEKIIDMFAGIGYFSIPLAKYGFPEEVIAVEINPESFNYLNENIHLNNVKIKSILSDNRDLNFEDYADRIIMGYIHTEEFVPYAVKMLRRNGIIHYHDTWTTEELRSRDEKIFSIFGEYMYSVERFHVLKSYAPHIWHVVIDVRIRKV